MRPATGRGFPLVLVLGETTSSGVSSSEAVYGVSIPLPPRLFVGGLIPTRLRTWE